MFTSFMKHSYLSLHVIYCAYLLISSHGFVISRLSSHYFHCENPWRYSSTHALPHQLLTWPLRTSYQPTQTCTLITSFTSQWNGFIQTHFMDHVIYIYPTNRDIHVCTQPAPVTIQWLLYTKPEPYIHLWRYTLSTVSLWYPKTSISSFDYQYLHTPN